MGTFSVILVVYALVAGNPAATAFANVTVIDNFQTLSSCTDAAAQLKQIHSATGNTDGSMRSQAYCFNHY